MTLLLTAEGLRARRAAARGPLSPLAIGLRRELEPLLVGDIVIPREKALLSRTGGRCDRDGTLLAYDPFDARHRCPTCGRELRGAEHDRFRLYWHQMWLAERAVHSALLGVLLDDPACISLASRLLGGYADQYLRYPDRDNVLGPSRPFFSTYLESIWLLQIAIALDLLEAGAPSPEVRALGGRVRDAIIAPSAALIASYDEGMSNRQVWNNAALIAAGRLLDRPDMIERATTGGSGLLSHLGSALLADGSWYEGENYHLFAHRGLWYGVQLAERHGTELPLPLRTRFMEGFAAPFRTVLPDLTYPSRRDSQYAASVRQPRFAESCELGLARGDDPRLLGMLARLYDPAVARRETGRANSSADIERNLPATGLSRADLSWRSLLLARETLPPLVPLPLESDLLPAQGFAILRRDEGALYVGLDYGHPGGGHGHPDRLNLLLSDGDARWFDDPGTGSYVDPSLHWYRSTLAHTAPLVDGRSQPRVHGELAAYEDRGRAGWVSADVELLPGLQMRRSVVVLEDYLVDVLQWAGDAEHEIALPWHGVDLVDEHDVPRAGTASPLIGGEAAEDGFSYVQGAERITPFDAPVARALGGVGSSGARRLRGWIIPEKGTTWWRALAPDVPSRPGLAPLLLARHMARQGGIVSVWGWRDTVANVAVEQEQVIVTRRDGRRDTHAVVTGGWRVDLQAGGARESLVLGGLASAASPRARQPARDAATRVPPIGLPARFELGERHYRRSEESWSEAGAPRAVVSLSVGSGRRLLIALAVEPSHRIFVPIDAENPLDNEPAAINGDGAQLYLACGGRRGGWLLVPRAGSEEVDARAVDGWSGGLEVQARWRPTESGWALDAEVALPPDCTELALDLLVNETAPGRARRRGQLVLSGADGEFVYLRGDRHDPSRLPGFIITDA